MYKGETITCKAAVAWESGKPLTIEDVQVAPPKKGEVRIKVLYSGVCHTDSYNLSGKDPEGNFPAILGHEGGGVVESVGEGVTSLKEGDHVIPLYIPECRECKFCKSGKTNLCSVVRESQGKGLMKDETVRFTCKGKKIHHFMGCSTFSQYTVCYEFSLAKIDSRAPLEKICLLGCGITTGYGAVVKHAKVEEGATIAVFGVGCIGLSCIQGAKACNASKIIAIDINNEKKELAMKFGATDFINPKEYDKPLQQVLIEMTDGGLDYTFECTGGSVELMKVALESCHKGWGQSIILSVAAAGEEASTKPFMLITGRVWRGCAFGGYKGRSELPKLVDMYMDRKLAIDEYVNNTYPLSKVNDAFEEMKSSSNCLRVVLNMFE